MKKKVLVVDIGGTAVKLMISHSETRKFDSGMKFSPKQLASQIRKNTEGWKYDAISIGFPAVVKKGRVKKDPKHLAPGWIDWDFGKSLGKPTRVINDASMQALGSYRGGRMLFLGLGTGLGSALVVDGVLEPMELAHLPYKNGRTFEQHVGAAALKRLGEKRWTKSVMEVVTQLKQALQADYVVLGGGNSKRLSHVPKGVFLGDNTHAREGGLRIWHSEHARKAMAAAGD